MSGENQPTVVCTDQRYHFINYLVSFVGGRLHLLVDPALELIGVPEELLQVEGVLQGGAARLGALVQGVAAAEQLKGRNVTEGECFEVTQRIPASAFSGDTYSISASRHIFLGVVVVLDQLGGKLVQGLGTNKMKKCVSVMTASPEINTDCDSCCRNIIPASRWSNLQ